MVKFEDFEIHRKELSIYARNLTKNKDKVEDLVQDTYIDFHRYLVKIDHNFKKPESLYGFLKVMLWRNWKHSKDLTYKRAQFSFFETKVDWQEDNAFNALKTPSINNTDYSTRELFLLETIRNVKLKTKYKLQEKGIVKRQKKIIELLLTKNYQKYEIARILKTSRQIINNDVKAIQGQIPKWIKNLDF